MSNREQDREENEAVIEHLASALREPVPVRAEWRNRVLDEIQALPHPRPATMARVPSWKDRRWVMSPLTGVGFPMFRARTGFAVAGLAPSAKNSMV